MFFWRKGAKPQCADPPPPVSAAEAGRNHLKKQNTSFLPTEMYKRYIQTITFMLSSALAST